MSKQMQMKENRLKKFIPQNFNDFLCLILILVIVALWILSGTKIVVLQDQVTGALIVTWTLLVQFYFRKKNSGSTPE